MNLLLEVFVKNGLVLDLAGIIGLSLLAFAALKLAKRDPSHGRIVVIGALALLIARIFVILAPSMINPVWLYSLHDTPFALIRNAPTVLLTAGLASIVWGLWGYEKELKEVPGDR
ncbi:MAG: hypothetical protein QM680_00590 [Luteolibacter sp.]